MKPLKGMSMKTKTRMSFAKRKVNLLKKAVDIVEVDKAKMIIFIKYPNSDVLYMYKTAKGKLYDSIRLKPITPSKKGSKISIPH